MAECTVNLYEAKTSLSKLVDRVAKGERIVIAKAGKPMARLVPLENRVAVRSPGDWAGRVHIGEDFDEPLPEEIQTAFEGSGK